MHHSSPAVILLFQFALLSDAVVLSLLFLLRKSHLIAEDSSLELIYQLCCFQRSVIVLFHF